MMTEVALGFWCLRLIAKKEMKIISDPHKCIQFSLTIFSWNLQTMKMILYYNYSQGKDKEVT